MSRKWTHERGGVFSPAQQTRLAADVPGAWWCILQENDGRRCYACEYRRKTARRHLCIFLGVTVPKGQLDPMASAGDLVRRMQSQRMGQGSS